MARELTDKQRSALEALRAAQAAGQGLCAYARAHGLNARQLHDAVAQLRRRGVLPPVQRAGQTPSAFVAVRVVDTPPTPRTGMICRVLHASGLVIECGEWPPAGWLLSLSAGRRDAAP
jgi:predicted transcriptional regulator